MNKILITGSNGYVATCLKNYLIHKNKNIVLLSRESLIDGKKINDLRNISDWKSILTGVHTIIHLAAYVHKSNFLLKKNAKINNEINSSLTMKIAENAKTAGVKNFIFLSSIGVLGSSTNESKFDKFSKYSPHSEYTNSKMLAEIQLREMDKIDNMNIIILRAPLIYGKDAKGNFGTLLFLMKLNLPLPFGLLNNNKRSYISINNLISCIFYIINSQKNLSGIYNISDNDDISTYELVKKIKKYSNSKSIIIPVPIYFLKLFYLAIGKYKWIESTIASLQIETTNEFSKLEWKPIYSIDEELQKIFLS